VVKILIFDVEGVTKGRAVGVLRRSLKKKA